MTDDLDASELVPRGGTWHGLLFANPAAGHRPALTWEFSFDFEPVERDHGGVEPGLTVDWAPLPAATAWTGVGGLGIECTSFADPVEASVYFFEHHRYDAVRLSVLEQDGPRVRARASVSGDLDGLGIPELAVEAWLRFEGVYVQLPEKPASTQAAAAALAEFTSVEGLAGRDRGYNYLFSPAAG